MYDKAKTRAAKIQIRRVLLEEWDPIGVQDEPLAQDEYDGYLGQIFDLRARGTSETDIADYLHHAETVDMGMPVQDPKMLLGVAASLKRIVL